MTEADTVEKNDINPEPDREGATRIAFTDDVNLPPSRRRALYVPPPRERDRGKSSRCIWLSLEELKPKLMGGSK